jgi:hypothetical protein
MTQTPVEIAKAYFQAGAERRFDDLIALVSDDIICDAPSGRVEGAPAFRAFWAGFVTRMVKRIELVGAYGDANSAVILYDCDLVPADNQPVAEALKVEDGRIVHSRLIFDRLPLVG